MMMMMMMMMMVTAGYPAGWHSTAQTVMCPAFVCPSLEEFGFLLMLIRVMESPLPSVECLPSWT